MAWRQTPISREQWEQNCRDSLYVRPGDEVVFVERHGKVHAGVKNKCIMLGVYFLVGQADLHCPILPGTGWNH
jgi:hypothetical protein